MSRYWNSRGKLRNNRWELSVDDHTQVSRYTQVWQHFYLASVPFSLFLPEEIFFLKAFILKFILSENQAIQNLQIMSFWIMMPYACVESQNWGFEEKMTSVILFVYMMSLWIERKLYRAPFHSEESEAQGVAASQREKHGRVPTLRTVLSVSYHYGLHLCNK